MSFLPDIPEIPLETVLTTEFKGYNHNERIEDGEMYDMTNLSGRNYPLLDQRVKRGITSYDEEGQDPVPLNGIHGRDQLCFIRGTEVWYGFRQVTGISVSDSAEMLPKKIVSMGAYVCIWPDKVYFNTADDNDKGSMDRTLTDVTGDQVSLTMCRNDGTDYDMTQITVSAMAPENPVNGQLWMDQSGDNDVLRQYSSGTKEWVEVPTVYIKVAKTGIGGGLKEYDAIEVAGLAYYLPSEPGPGDVRLANQVSALNGSQIVYGAGDDYFIIAGLLSRTVAAGDLEDSAISADRKVPDLDYVCESNNRLWGCKYGPENGVVVNEIRACKLGDFKNWQCFMGLSTDSYTASVGTDGPFTAAVTQLGYPVIFKEDCIHRVSGNTPSTFQITTTKCRGVQQGSWASAAVVNEAIYYKSRTDVMMYDGSMPQSISRALGNVLYSSAAAGAVGGKYYISMKDESDQWSLFVYDTLTGMWHREDGTRALGFGRVEDELFFIDPVTNTVVAVNGSMGTKEEQIEWSATFGLFGTDYVSQKYLSRFNLRMGMEPGSWAKLSIQYDGDGEWHDEGEMRNHASITRTSMIPVVPRRCDHLQVRLDGRGECRIFSIARMLEVGGDG